MDTKKTVVHNIVLEKEAKRQLTDSKNRAAIEALLAGVNSKARSLRGWKIDVVPRSRYVIAGSRPDPKGKYGELIYDVQLTATVEYTVERASLNAEFQNIVSSIIAKAAVPKWTVAMVDGSKYEPVVESNTQDEIGYAPIVIPDNWRDNFAHLYGLDPHITRVFGALEAAIRSDWVHRFHGALVGPPGCGKSDVCASLKRALGEEAVMEFDATATTAAGALLELKEREELPRVLVVEEIEKAAENSMQWLLSIMDLRGNIKKRTARGNIDRNTRMLVFATVNDFHGFEKVASGALASRFSNKIFFQRPGRDLLERILVREIESVGGDMRWIAPTLDFAEQRKTTDPREVIALALCGRDGLLDGSYQRDVTATGTYVNE